ncbi:MAG: lytic transglycosylase domain-containing protein [Treponema sp.]|nr:lytic transglycosylase domain-containing protein [Treponema sp.]
MLRVLFSVLFFLFFGLNACAAQRSASNFYEGLKKEQAEAIVHFEKALNSANTAAAAAAAAELMKLRFAGAELSAATMTRIRQKATGSWAEAFAIPETPNAREKALALLLNGENRLPGDAAQYVLHRWRNSDTISFTDAENAAINGRLAASRFRYNEALVFFRITIHDSPELFFHYPELLNDLGRTFQYTATGTEGMDLFLQWEQTFPAVIPADSEHIIRFRLLFFAARIARQRGEPNIALFERALVFAPKVSAEQTDACIWYILDSSLAQGPDTTIPYLKTYIPMWNDDASFSDVVDKLTRELILKKQWEHIAYVFTLLKDRSNVITARYAWIIGRAIEEGFFSDKHNNAGDYMRIAYNAHNALYYRSLSAAILNEPFLTLTETKPSSTKPPPAKNQSESMRFLLGFFEHNAAEFAPRYIRAMEKNLSSDELRPIAAALGAAGQYQESIRLASFYTRRDGYQTKRADLELLYPRPYKELIEQYAEKTGIDPALLFALIRTESAFESAIVSRTGAVGLTQLMPATAEEFAGRIRRRGGPDYTDALTLNLRDPEANIHIGTSYLVYLNERMGDPLLALLAYNGGMNRVRRWHGAANLSVNAVLPPDLFLETVEFSETRNYGRSVIAAAAMYEYLYYKPNKTQ